jgi:hypothetical protein
MWTIRRCSGAYSITTELLINTMSLSRYYHTLKYLHSDQLFYRVTHTLKSKLFPPKPYTPHPPQFFRLPDTVTPFPLTKGKYLGGNHFNLLNITHEFTEGIDWSYDKYGMLWTFKLNYFEYLLDEGCDKEDAIRLLDDWCRAEPAIKVGKMAYPISLRTINWLKAMVRFGIKDHRHIAVVRCELDRLYNNLEYHVLGNHLLENSFALVVGGLAFKDLKLLNKGISIFDREFPEQILDDGGHFERSPMYQQILLERMLDILNFAKNTSQGKAVVAKLEPVVVKMMAWLDRMTFANGNMACFNDAVSGMSMTTAELKDYARRLGITLPQTSIPLGASGYRRFDTEHFECIMDVGDVGPDYLPAHAHSDTLSFCLSVHGIPHIVDTGISTYQPDQIRQRERSTSAHNTVVVDGKEQSEAWGSFRMARRAHAMILEENELRIRATHDGYRSIRSSHVRTFSHKDDAICIEDCVFGGSSHEAFFHFAPGIEPCILDAQKVQAGSLVLRFSGANKINIETYEHAVGFNLRVPAQRLMVSFSVSMQTAMNLT